MGHNPKKKPKVEDPDD